MPADGARICTRLDKLKGKKVNYDGTCEELARYILPSQLGFQTKRTEGAKRDAGLLDSVGIHANEVLSANLAGTLTNEALKWFGLKMTDPALNTDDAVAEHLEAETEAILLALGQSNFYSEMLEVYAALGAFGMAALFSEEMPIARPGFNGLRFEAWPLKSVWIAENAYRQVDTVYHEFEFSAEAAVKRWPATIGDDVKRKAAQDPDAPVTFVHAIAPRPRGEPGLPIASTIVERASKRVVDEGGYHEMPVQVPRWRKATDEIYGRGPGHTALADLKMLNRAKEQEARAWAKVIDPPQAINKNTVLTPVRLQPGGLTVVDGDPRTAIVDLVSQARFDVTQIKADALRAAVREVYLADALQLPQAGPEMTAREVLVRYEIMQRRFGPSLGRIMAELLTPLITRVRGLLARAGVLPALPPILANRDWTVQYESPLARAQRLGEVDAMERYEAWLLQTAQAKPEVLDYYQWEDAARLKAERLGVPASLIPDPRRVRQLRTAQARQAREAQAKADAAQLAASAGQLAPLVKAEQGAGRSGAAADLAEAA